MTIEILVWDHFSAALSFNNFLVSLLQEGLDFLFLLTKKKKKELQVVLVMTGLKLPARSVKLLLFSML